MIREGYLGFVDQNGSDAIKMAKNDEVDYIEDFMGHKEDLINHAK